MDVIFAADYERIINLIDCYVSLWRNQVSSLFIKIVKVVPFRCMYYCVHVGSSPGVGIFTLGS